LPVRIESLPAVHTLRKFIPATEYNRIRLALRRLENPLRFPLANMRCLEMILTDTFWLCIDSCREDRPVLAWTGFETSSRSGIHEAVACDLRLFHVHAGLVMGEILENTGVELQHRLAGLEGAPEPYRTTKRPRC
jgi:hypothetical protein